MDKKLQPYLIYVFRDDDTYYSCGRAITAQGMDEIYQYGFRIQKDPNKVERVNNVIMQEKRAKREVITRVNNALNAIWLYGKRVVDSNGEIDWEKFKYLEMESAWQANKGTEIIVPIEKTKPIQKFKIKDLTLQKAIKMGLLS